MDPNDRASQILQFGVFEVDLAQGELRKHGRKIKLQERPFQLLAALLERPGQLVTREELVRKLWNDTLVDFDNGLNIAAKKIREALDDDAATPRYLETLPRRGYRFIAPVQARNMQPVEAPPPKQPARPVPTIPAVPTPAPPLPRRRAKYVRAAALIVVVFLAVRIYLVATTVRPARLVQVVQLTQTGQIELGNGVATDGTRVYFTQRDSGRWSLAQVSVEGGTPLPLPLPLEQPLSNPDILDISPDRSNLLVSSGAGTEPERPFWVVPTAGGSSRRVGDVAGHAGAWSRDGNHIVFARGAALFLVGADGTDSRKLLDTPGIPSSIRWAPPSRADVLRFSMLSPTLGPAALWEVDSGGTRLRSFVRNWSSGAAEPDGDDNGNWAANGKYYLFRALRGPVSSVYAMRAFRRFPRTFEGPPVLIYSTPMEFSSLAPHPDGKRVFFAAGQQRLELVRYDPRHGQFGQFLSGVQSRSIGFSKDGQWIAYVTAPDGTLWRSRPDGSQRLQLTSPPMRASQPRWSPDGSRIVFGGGPAGHTSRVYLVPSTGGAPEPVTDAPLVDGDASWSAGGNSLVFARGLHPGASGQPGLYLMDLNTKKAAPLPGSEALAQPAWSPDGRYIAATNQAGTQVLLLNLDTRQWAPLVSGDGLGSPFWSKDSRYVYGQDALAPDQPIFRVAVGAAKKDKKENIVSAKQIPQSNFISYVLAGLGPDDAPIATVIYANSDIYALGVDLP
ncbi:MAG TPA: winged helix-turn-helix domain-containing protein [Bryobacteraceae bacterium]|nr:winged helix-turn-helix domain-containing protein [Bryobacteraceae bacterium]